MDEDIEDLAEEIEISIIPRHDSILQKGFTLSEFEVALDKALELHEQMASDDQYADEEIPTINMIPIILGGASIPLGDLADIEITRIDSEEDKS